VIFLQFNQEKNHLEFKNYLVEEVGNDNMTLLCKNKALYVKACIIQNGVADTDGDILNSEDIKKIFTTFNNQNNFEINHNDLPISEVSLLENYISKSEEIIAGTNVPSGSWNAIIRVDNPSIKDKLLSGEFGGVSLNNRVKDECAKKRGLVGEVTYEEIGDMECVIPLLISFVDEPANKVGLHIMDYDTYIKKSRNNKNFVKSDKMSLLDKLKEFVAEAEIEAENNVDEPTGKDDAAAVDVGNINSANESEDEEDKVEVEKADDNKQEDDEEEAETAAANDEEEEKAEATKSDDEKKDEEEGAAVEKAEEEIVEPTTDADKITALENRVQLLEEKVNGLIGDEEETGVIDEEAVPNSADEPLITKSSKIEITNEPNVNAAKNFYEMTGRDAITGKRIRNRTKILN